MDAGTARRPLLPRVIAAVALTFLAPGPGSAIVASAPVVTEVRIGTDQGALVIEVVASEPLSFAVTRGSTPFAVSLYLLNVTFAFPPVAREVKEGALNTVIVSMHERPESRLGQLEFVFDQEIPYRVSQQGTRLLLHMDVPGTPNAVLFGTSPRVVAAASVNASSESGEASDRSGKALEAMTPRSATTESTKPEAGTPEVRAAEAVSPAPAPPESRAAPLDVPRGRAPLTPVRATRIHRVHPVEAQDEAHVSVEADGSLSYRAFTLTAPPRLVVDFDNVAYGPGRSTLPARGLVLAGTRASQFRITPTPVVRVVFDLKRVAPYWIEPQAWGVVVHIGTSER